MSGDFRIPKISFYFCYRCQHDVKAIGILAESCPLCKRLFFAGYKYNCESYKLFLEEKLTRRREL